MLGANGIVGGGLPITAGAGLAAQFEGSGDVAVGFFGDGATGEGPFHESLNIAALWKLPVSGSARTTATPSRRRSQPALAADERRRSRGRLRHPRLHRGRQRRRWRSYEAAREAVGRARAGEGPTLLECKTWRRGSSTPCASRRRQSADRPTADRALGQPATRSSASSSAWPSVACSTDAPRRHPPVDRPALDDAVEFAEASPFPSRKRRWRTSSPIGSWSPYQNERKRPVMLSAAKRLTPAPL